MRPADHSLRAILEAPRRLSLARRRVAGLAQANGGKEYVPVPTASNRQPPWRRWLAYSLVAVAVLATAAVVYVQWNPRRYLSLRPLAELGPTITVALAAPVLLASAVLLAATPGRRRTVTASVLLALVLPVGCAGYVKDEFLAEEWKPRSIAITARSPDGHWVVVAIRYTSAYASDYYYDEFHLRSHAGWLSREAPRPLAVVGYTVHENESDQLNVVRIEFHTGSTIEVYTNDGAVHSTSFDPASLAIDDKFETCDDDLTHLCP